MRVISGKWRGKKLLTVDSNEIRPTTDRIKETIFNMLATKKFGSRLLHNAIILDCFSGTGALAIEALSRGSRLAYIWDNSKKSIDIIKQNLQNIDENLYEINQMDSYVPKPINQPADIIFIDPPYAKMSDTPNLLDSLENTNWIDSHTLLIIESASSNRPELSNNHMLLEEKTMGNTTVIFARKQEKLK